MRLSYGCPGGGVGRCRTRFSGAESDSSTPPPLPTSPPAAISKRMDVPPTGERIALDPLVARVLAPNSSPYTYTGTQTHLVGTRDLAVIDPGPDDRSEEHTSELQSLMRISYAVFCLKKKKKISTDEINTETVTQ